LYNFAPLDWSHEHRLFIQFTSCSAHPNEKRTREDLDDMKKQTDMENNLCEFYWTDWSKCINICKCSYWSWCKVKTLYNPWWCRDQGRCTVNWFELHKCFWNSMFSYFILQENAVVSHAIVGWKSSIGLWARVQAS